MTTISFYDGKDNTAEPLVADKILFEDDVVCLCQAAFFNDEEEHYIMFNKITKEVLSIDFTHWYAEITE